MYKYIHFLNGRSVAMSGVSIPYTSDMSSSPTGSDTGPPHLAHLNHDQTEVIMVKAPADAGPSESGEPPLKRHCPDDVELSSDNMSIKQIMFNINKAICLRLDTIETKLDAVSVRTKMLEAKMEQIIQQGDKGVVGAGGSGMMLQDSPDRTQSASGKRANAVVVGLPQSRTVSVPTGNGQGSVSSSSSGDSIQNLGPNVTLITLNTEDDFPQGTWLGDEHNPEMRVRVPVTPSDLLHIHSNCRTPEKMALTLLDYLFDRDTQATSNLSGMGKHGKKQLDPLMVYGIRCHLIVKFGITEQDWHRIKQNIDSKCRTAFRRRQKGLPLTIESPQLIRTLKQEHMQHVEGVMGAGAGEIIQTPAGEIQVLHATPEQVAQLQQGGHIQILNNDQIVHLQGSGMDEGNISVLQMQTVPTGADMEGGVPEGVHTISTDAGNVQAIVSESGEVHTISTESGDTIQIHPSDMDDNDPEDSEGELQVQVHPDADTEH